MSYTNPVYSGSCPDPFVLRFCGEYWCYSTGWAPDGKVFHILHSRDLIHWKSVGGAMEPLPGGAPEYWAPEVYYLEGDFYMYYSVGDGIRMTLRASVADDPEGPFSDCGRVLTDDDFAIDPHVFEDEDGRRYLFYAKDFPDHTHIGTGIVADRLLDPLTLEGKPHPIALPRFDWQVFDPRRMEKGGVRWHTVEGPFVLRHKGRYYQMFSGGNWKNITYGVSFALTDSIDSQQEWVQLEHNEEVPLVLATIPGHVIGPGHNSVIRGPDNRQLYCVYHRWAPDESARLLSLDRLEWIGDRLSVLGPSTTPQENPNAPQYPIFRCTSGLWKKNGLEWTPSSAANAQSVAGLDSDFFAMEVSLASQPGNRIPEPQSEFGLKLLAGPEQILQVGIHPSRNTLGVSSIGAQERVFPFSAEFPSSKYHLLRLELNALQLMLHLDGRACWSGPVLQAPDSLALFSQKTGCSLRGLSITYGFEDAFYGYDGDPGLLGWHPQPGNSGIWKISGGELQQTDPDALNSVLVKEHPFRKYELVINARVIGDESADAGYGFYPTFKAETQEGPLLRIEKRENYPYLAWYSQQGEGAWRLPDSFNCRRAQQFRFKNQNGKLQVYYESEALGSIEAPEDLACVALYSHKARVSFDLVRLTSLLSDGIEI